MCCIKLHCIYFKSMCFVTTPLVDSVTLFCLEVTATEETKELFIICIIFKIIIIIIVSRFGLLVVGLCSSGQSQ